MRRADHAARGLLALAGMIDVRGWDRFVTARPGRRFFERYQRMRQAQSGAWKRCAFVCAGILVCLAGIFFLVVPGPGLLILAVGLALIAQESAWMARLLDRLGLRLRRLWASYRGRGSRTR